MSGFIYYKNKIIKNVLLSMKDSKEEMADKNKGWLKLILTQK